MALALRQGLTKLPTTTLNAHPESTLQLGGARNGGNLKEIRRRIKSVGSIQKITKTMKMIASSRLREAQNRMESSRPFSRTSQDVTAPAPEGGKTIILPICTDKGLCGGLNSSVVKTVKTLSNDDNSSIVVFGDKGNAQLARGYGNRIHFSAGGASKRALNWHTAAVIADRVLEKDYDKITVVFNQFVSALANETVSKNLAGPAPLAESTEALTEYEFEEEDRLTHVRDLLEFQLSSLLYQASTENSAAELGSRMSAMDNATKNAGEMIKKLNITYNRARQAAITTELTEIISGAAAVEG